ncbi:probable terpene synthase 11 [Elaeis guineensis]|uniref:Probable terpene synthase 11 n=1 Tax=Elaeis guineensis var. tenera TaxID=51953 RepID=A0A6I9QEZ6_ELAGV|nr:probable terpene synthase 11 [Elaeis guineensis]
MTSSRYLLVITPEMAGIGYAVFPLGVHCCLRKHSWKPFGGRRERLASSCRVSDTFKCIQCYSLPTSQDNMVHLEASSFNPRIEELKEGVRKILFNNIDLRAAMVLVDTLQHLGIGYHFEEETNGVLDRCYGTRSDDDDLFITALRFRLLRQGGYSVTPDVFHKFMDNKGNFKDPLAKNRMALLSLHEASFLGAKDEEVLSQAMEFTKHHLQKSKLVSETSVARDIGLALEFPRQRRMERLEARSFIEKYRKECGRSSAMLELATLDFNMVQSLYQKEIAELESWWRDLGVTKKLSFARDRPLECFLWTVGLFPEPCLSTCRIEVTKAVAILVVIDDMYDSYGSLEDLNLFTNAIQRWEIGEIEKLPEYMKICYVALYNTINDVGYKVLKEYGWFIIPHLRKTWVDLCEAYFTEARWFSNGVVPNLEDYVSNGVTSVGTYVALVLAFFLTGKQVNKETSSLVNSWPKLFTSAGRIFRLWDDLGTAMAEQQRGDVASSIECYMNENSTSQDEARVHIRNLINSSWQDLNKECYAMTQLPRSIIKASLNLARTSQDMYRHGDDDKFLSTDELILSLLIKPIQI